MGKLKKFELGGVFDEAGSFGPWPKKKSKNVLSTKNLKKKCKKSKKRRCKNDPFKLNTGGR